MGVQEIKRNKKAKTENTQLFQSFIVQESKFMGQSLEKAWSQVSFVLFYDSTYCNMIACLMAEICFRSFDPREFYSKTSEIFFKVCETRHLNK